jgi:hypothetical protein
MIICLQAVYNKLGLRYFADGTSVVLADNSHFVNASVTNRFVVAFPHSDELGFLCAKYAVLLCHFGIIKLFQLDCCFVFLSIIIFVGEEKIFYKAPF